ncbi:MAG: arsenate reductase ArsC [Candidatus Babeliales bacterium]
MRILILCNQNSARSVILEGYLKKLRPEWEIFSAGIKPAKEVNPYAIKIMTEDFIDIGSHKPINVTNFLNQSFDYVIIVCNGEQAECPTFSGYVKTVVQAPFQDPAKLSGSNEEKLEGFRKIRDQIKKFAYSFIKLKSQ